MATVNENIFSDSIKLVLRYDHKAESAFDKAHKEWIFSEFVKLLNNNERECHLTRKDDKEHRIIVPMPEEKYGGQLEIVAEWIPSKFSYEIKVNGKKKTKYNPQVTDIDKKYSIEESCEFVFLGEDDPFNDLEALRELKDLKERVDKLEIMTQAQIEDARKLWTKFIYAQQLRISKLQEPFECQGEPSLEPISNSKGETNKFKLTVPIKPLIPYNAFNELINEYNENFGGNISIETDTGISWMTKNEIEDVDKILHRTLGDSYERDSEITCILRIEPMDIRDQLYAELNMSTNRRYYVEYNKDDKMLHIWVNNENVPRIPLPIREKYNLTHSGVFCKFTKIDEFDHKYTEIDRNIPEKNPSFSAIQKLADIMEAKAKAKKYEWEKEGDYKNVDYKIGCIYKYSYKELCDKILWGNIRRELYGLDYRIFNKNKTISFDFSDFNQLKDKIKTLTDLRLFKLNRNNPLNKNYEESFKFMVRFRITNGISTSKFNILEKLKNVAFVAEIANPEKEKNIHILFVGNLNGYESNDNQLVFNLPYYSPDDESAAKNIISFLENEEEDKDKQETNKKDEPTKKKNKEFVCVHADLKGDEVKLKWLREAIDKLSDKKVSSSKPNSKPVNPRLRDFIFDSSKATPTYKFEGKEISETEEYRNVRKRQLLDLNESQLISVVKALNAKDMCLLQGPPGTGKTTVIAELIWQHIMENSLTRILVTSETNLAVDNALEKLMNGKNVSTQLSRYLHIIKPLRFGSASKFEEEGRRFSVERIERWLDEECSQDYEYENELSNLDDADNELQGDVEQPDPSYNAVQDWMCSIADRSQDGDIKYSKILKEFKNELRNPSTITKRYFKDKYFKYANIIGSTCSSTGSPSFALDYAKVYSSGRCDEYIKSENYEITISDIKQLIEAGKEKNDFATTARKIVEHILKENDIKRKEDFDELLTNPTNDFKHYLFDYELKNLLREYSRNPEGDKTNKLMQTLDFETIEEFNQFRTISFDTVIMDEASKATPPDLVLPLCFGEKSIIIGDHRQLPPMLNDKEFKESIYELNDPQANELVEEIDREFTDTSQFSRLILNPSVSPTLKSVFTVQYRMHPQINDVISQFYTEDEGGLRCGLDLSKVDSEDLSEIESRHHGFYHDGFISKDVHTLWVNVDGPELRAESGALYNDSEVEAVKRVLTYLHNSEGFKEYMSYWDNNIKDEQKRNLEKEIGIISFYSRQVRKLGEAKTLAKKLGMKVRLNTVDKFQGMERNIVIVSTVRSGKRMKNGNIVENRDSGFAKSPERLNVALSRARRLLIVVGDSEFFSNVRDRNKILLYKNVIDEIQRHSEIIDYKSLTKYQAK